METRLSGELQRALDRIPERQRAALLLAEVHDLTGLELAAALGVSHVAARALLTRARESLRQALAAETRGRRDGRGEGRRRTARGPFVSPSLRRGADHERARELAAQRVGEVLAPGDAAWLDAHLAACDACAAVASDYDADRAALRSLRGASPEPPRDLWARTAAAIEAEAARGRGAFGAGRPARRVLGLPAAVLAPAAGLAVVAIVVGAALFNGVPLPPGIGPGATPFALAGGNVAVLSRGADGSIEIHTGSLHEVCPLTANGCTVEPSFDFSHVGPIGTSGDVEAVISPSRDRIVVIPRGASGSGGVFVVPVHTPAPTVSAAPATATPAVTATAAPTGAPTELPTESPTASNDATPTPGPVEPSASATASETPSSEPPSASPSESPSSPATKEPAESPAESPAPTDAPTATPVVAVTPRPDGAIEIASGVLVVPGPATYSADGSRFAFTARPADGSGGPDVYVWDTKDTVARAITDDHRSVFADWAGNDLLVSRVEGGVPTTTRIDATTGKGVGEPSRRAWLPALSPDGTRAVWWDGSVALGDDGVTLVPDAGRLVVGSWPQAGTDVQTLTDGKIGAWQVRWDPAGTALAAWVAPKTGREAGRLSLYRLDEATGRADLAKPLLDGEPALGAFTLEPGMLAWSAPGKTQGRTVQVLAWKGDQVGRAELPADGGATLVQ